MVKVHQNSVDTYLENIVLNSIDNTADVQARTEISELADKINDIAYDLEDKYVSSFFYYAPRKISGEHIVAALSVRPYVPFVSGP